MFFTFSLQHDLYVGNDDNLSLCLLSLNSIVSNGDVLQAQVDIAYCKSLGYSVIEKTV